MLIKSTTSEEDIFVSNEVLQSIINTVRYDDLPALSSVCRSFRSMSGFIMRKSLQTQLQSRDKDQKNNVTNDVLEGLLDDMDHTRLTKAFRSSLPHACRGCHMQWVSPEVSSFGLKLCAACFEGQRFMPLSAAVKSNWVPTRELEFRKMLHTIPYGTEPRKAYQVMRKPDWQRNMPRQLVSATDVETVSQELFGNTPPAEAKRKVIYKRYEIAHRKARDASWDKIATAQPHADTVLQFAQHAVKTQSVPTFITTVLNTYQEHARYWMSARSTYAPEFYGNALIPGMMRVAGSEPESHRNYTRWICTLSVQRVSRP